MTLKLYKKTRPPKLYIIKDSMDLHKLNLAIKIIENNPVELDLRQITYLRTYPAILSLAANSAVDVTNNFLQVSTLAYGWMPRILRIRSTQIDAAIKSYVIAKKTNISTVTNDVIKPIADCLCSVVGASKVLHFINPVVFPIWDFKVETVWKGLSADSAPSQQFMSNIDNYLDYFHEVHELRSLSGFEEFYKEFIDAYNARNIKLNITKYSVSHVRAIEAAAFELSSGNYEEG